MKPGTATVTPTSSGVVESLRREVPFLLAIVAVVLIYSFLPLGTALELGGDEGYELTMAFLVKKGFSLYTQIWNDQPPVFTMVLSCALRVFGDSILVPRLVAAGFGLVLFGSLYQLVRLRSGVWAAVGALFFLVASPGVLQLSSSVMLEVPAIGTALLAAWLLFQWCRNRHGLLLVSSGAVMGIALQTKLTAVMVAPAILAQIALADWDRARPGGGAERSADNSTRYRRCLTSLLIWSAAAGAVFLAVACTWAAGSFESSWRSHTASRTVPGLSSPEDHRFDPTLLLRHPECLAGGLAAVVFLRRRGRWREIAFPVMMLTTALGIHSVHRPWWSYYYLHLAVPLAWLSGVVMAEVLKSASQLFSAGKARVLSSTNWRRIAAGALTALGLAVSEARLEAGIKHIRQSPKASESPVLAKMNQYADRTHWVYTQPVIFPFHARLAVPPELAVVMLKRYWSGQITPKEIVAVCRRYQPEQVLLWRERIGSEWKDFLGTEYWPAYQDTNYALFVTKSLDHK